MRSDGLLRIYTLTTPYGEFTVHGDQMLRMRVNELAALHELEKIANSDSYGKALVDAGLSPFKYTGRLITDPKKTVGDTFSGIGTHVRPHLGRTWPNIGKTPGDPISGLLGVTDQRRKLATKVGVDPYTDFPPLDAKLSRLSEAAAAGGLTVSAAMLAVPVNAVGIVVFQPQHRKRRSRGCRSTNWRATRPPSQIFDLNREQLRAMGADNDLIEALLANRNYTPIDMAVLVAALDSMPDVEDRTVFLQRAAQIDTRSLAYFMRRHAEMLKNHQSRGAGFVRFVSLGGYPFNVTRDGRIVGVDADRQPGLDGDDRGASARMRGRCAQVLADRAGRAPHHRHGDAAGQARSFRRWAGGWWKTTDFEPSAAVAGDFAALLYAV